MLANADTARAVDAPLVALTAADFDYMRRVSDGFGTVAVLSCDLDRWCVAARAALDAANPDDGGR